MENFNESQWLKTYYSLKAHMSFIGNEIKEFPAYNIIYFSLIKT